MDIYQFIKLVFVLGFLLASFAYIGFPLLLKLLSLILGNKETIENIHEHKKPFVQVIISIYNEERFIEHKINGILSYNYPADKLSILFISDGSNDNSEEIIRKADREHGQINLFSIKSNIGKNNAINAAFESGQFKGELLCFSDVDGIIEPETLDNVVKFFEDPKVGLVGGKVSYWLGSGSANQAEGAFWRLENFIREAEGNLGWLVSCTGQFIIMRGELFQPLPPEANTDFALPLMVLAKGYATIFDPKAKVRSLFPSSQKEVLRRRHRTVVRALTTISFYRKRLPWRLRQILFWHKTIRFYMFPVQIVVLMSNIFLAVVSPIGFWQVMLGIQLLFYGLTVAGWLTARTEWKVPLVFLPYQFTLQNAAVFGAVINYFKGERVAKWTPPR